MRPIEAQHQLLSLMRPGPTWFGRRPLVVNWAQRFKCLHDQRVPVAAVTRSLASYCRGLVHQSAGAA